MAASITGAAKLQQLQPWLAPYVARVIAALEHVGIGGAIYDVYRSPADQDRRFSLGDTRARAGQSAHQYGLAFDFVVSQGETSQRQRDVQEFWKHLGFTVLEWDPSHVEFPNWRALVGK